jgi:hypothetical protein
MRFSRHARNSGTTSTGAQEQPAGSAPPFTVLAFLKDHFNLFNILGVVGTMIFVLPNLIDKYVRGQMWYFIPDLQASYMPYLIAELPMVCEATFLLSLFLIIVMLAAIGNRNNERTVRPGWFPVREGDCQRLVFLAVFLPVGFVFIYFLVLVPFFLEYSVSMMLVIFWFLSVTTIALAAIFSRQEYFEEHKPLLFTFAILYGILFFFSLRAIPEIPGDTPYALSLVWVFAGLVLAEIILLLSPGFLKVNPFDRHRKAIALSFAGMAAVIVISLFAMTILPVVNTPYSDPGTSYGDLSIAATPTEYSPAGTDAIGMRILIRNLEENKNITSIGLFSIQHHYSTNYGYFVVEDPDSNLIAVGGQQVAIESDDVGQKVYWTYPVSDTGKKKPPVVIAMHVEDEMMPVPFLQDRITLKWVDIDTVQVEEKPESRAGDANLIMCNPGGDPSAFQTTDSGNTSLHTNTGSLFCSRGL